MAARTIDSSDDKNTTETQELGGTAATSLGRAYLEVQVQDVVLVEVVHAFTDLLGEQDHIQFSQMVLLIRDPVEEFTPIHTASTEGEMGIC